MELEEVELLLAFLLLTKSSKYMLEDGKQHFVIQFQEQKFAIKEVCKLHLFNVFTRLYVAMQMASKFVVHLLLFFQLILTVTYFQLVYLDTFPMENLENYPYNYIAVSSNIINLNIIILIFYLI